ncbi:hypothetical protein R1sor_017303 [Riccia sorocarpa]|uniref:tRNA (guanine-N(7)-)-methyltransferase non-catalytic subunit n=1 Tax=Riccia sorocarpa TaxID=122646 RepID=A0ABD3IAF3_9MARC
MEDDEASVGVGVGELMAPALISAHPDGSCVVVAIGARLRVFDLVKNQPVVVSDETVPARHGEAIRAIAFNDKGNFFSSAGDDKLVKLWNSESWSCIKTVRIPKKVTSVTFSKDSKWVLFADKFGAVYTIPTVVKEEKDEPIQLLGHCCSIITDLEVSSQGKYIVTSDRDFKIRVSVFPADPLKGAPEIWSYCLGHTSFVTCTAFVGPRNPGGQQLLVSGGGDSTVRLWDYVKGKMLHVFDTAQLEALRDEETPDDAARAVIGLSVSPDGSVVAVLLERFSGVLLLVYDDLDKTLKHHQCIVLSEHVFPTSLAFDVTSRLWIVAGAAESFESGDQLVTPEEAAAAEDRAQMIAKAAVAHVSLVVRRSPTSAGQDEENCGRFAAYELCERGSMPGAETLLSTLEGSRANSGEVAVAAEAAEQAMKKLMSKRQYTLQERDNRKRFRNDKKFEKCGTGAEEIMMLWAWVLFARGNISERVLYGQTFHFRIACCDGLPSTIMLPHECQPQPTPFSHSQSHYPPAGEEFDCPPPQSAFRTKNKEPVNEPASQRRSKPKKHRARKEENLSRLTRELEEPYPDESRVRSEAFDDDPNKTGPNKSDNDDSGEGVRTRSWRNSKIFVLFEAKCDEAIQRSMAVPRGVVMRTKEMWDLIARKCQANGVMYVGAQCQGKWNMLVYEYLKILDHNARSGREP